MALAVPLLRTRNEFASIIILILLLFVAFPLLLLTCMDLGKALRAEESKGFLLKVLAMLFSVSRALLGLLAVVFGVSIILWALYNYLIERRPEFPDFLFPSLGIGPALVAVGLYWLRDCFGRGKKA